MNRMLYSAIAFIIAAQSAIYAMDPIHAAAFNGDIETFKQFVDDGFTLDEYDAIGWTPAHYAVLAGHTPIINILRQNADLTVTDFLGRTPLHYAAKNGDINMVDTLFFDDAARSVLGNKDCLGWTPHDYAMANKSCDYQIDWAFREAARKEHIDISPFVTRKHYPLLQALAGKCDFPNTVIATWFPAAVQREDATQTLALKAMIAPLAIIAVIEELAYQHQQ